MPEASGRWGESSRESSWQPLPPQVPLQAHDAGQHRQEEAASQVHSAAAAAAAQEIQVK